MSMRKDVAEAQKEYEEGKTKSLDYVLGFVDGKAEGARRERRALRSSFKRQPPSHRDCILGDWVRHWLAARSKAKPTREGK